MVVAKLNCAVLLAASLPAAVWAQTYQRLGTCPTLGCVLPPDQSDFLPGQLFDLRVEVHAPVNGSEAVRNGTTPAGRAGKPDEKFRVTIAKEGQGAEQIAKVFTIEEPKLEKWTFKWYEDLFAEDRKTPSLVNVASKAYRKLSLNEPGKYTVTLEYNGGQKTTAEWFVRPIVKERRAKNVIFFIGDGMTTNMVRERSAAPGRGLLGGQGRPADVPDSRSQPPACSATRAPMANTRPACRWTSFRSSVTR